MMHGTTNIKCFDRCLNKLIRQ